MKIEIEIGVVPSVRLPETEDLGELLKEKEDDNTD